MVLCLRFSLFVKKCTLSIWWRCNNLTCFTTVLLLFQTECIHVALKGYLLVCCAVLLTETVFFSSTDLVCCRCCWRLFVILRLNTNPHHPRLVNHLLDQFAVLADHLPYKDKSITVSRLARMFDVPEWSHWLSWVIHSPTKFRGTLITSSENSRKLLAKRTASWSYYIEKEYFNIFLFLTPLKLNFAIKI